MGKKKMRSRPMPQQPSEHWWLHKRPSRDRPRMPILKNASIPHFRSISSYDAAIRYPEAFSNQFSSGLTCHSPTMMTYRRMPQHPIFSPPPALYFNGGYGANSACQAPYAVNDTAAMYYPNHYQVFPCVVGQELVRLSWHNSTQPASAVQGLSQPYPNTPGYFYMGSNSYCGQSSVLYNSNQFTQRVEHGAESSSQPQHPNSQTFMTQIPTSLLSKLSINPQGGFIGTIARKVHISRPAKYAWNFSSAQLHSLVDCCIARKHEAEGILTPLGTFSSQIENIETPRGRNGIYKGYAILTFKDPKAANLAVEALNREGHFSAKIDKDQLPASTQCGVSVSWKVYVGRIPSYFSRHFFWGLIEECIPSTFATISACGIPMYECIESFDFPSRVDGTSEGYASMTFNSEVVANIVVSALQERGFGAYLEERDTSPYQPQIEIRPDAQLSQKDRSASRRQARQAVRSVPKLRVPRVAQVCKNVRASPATQPPPTLPESEESHLYPAAKCSKALQYSLAGRFSPVTRSGAMSCVPLRPASVVHEYGSWHSRFLAEYKISG